MALVVNTNIASLQSQYSLSQSRSALEQAMERLSSGSRINSAGDDAAGLSISTRMDSQIRGLEASISNANDGISLLQTAEGAMDEITAMLQRMRELAVQSSNGINNQQDRDALNAEAQQLLAEIDRVVGDTTFNDQAILDGSYNSNIQIGSEAGQTLGVNLGNLSTYALGSGMPSNGLGVQREASIFGKAVGTTDATGNRVVATTVQLDFDSNDTYRFTLNLGLTDANGDRAEYEFDVSGSVVGGSARDIALDIQNALRQAPTQMAGGTAGSFSTVIDSAADMIDVSYSGSQVTITNKLGDEIEVTAGNYLGSTGFSNTRSGGLSDSGGTMRFTALQETEADGSLITGTYDSKIIGDDPSWDGTEFTVNGISATTSTSGTSTTATAASLKLSLADISDTTLATLNQISTGDVIALTLVDENGNETFVFTDSVSGVTSSTALVGVLNNALVAAGADDTYSIAWTDEGGDVGGTNTNAGTFTITRDDGVNFGVKLNGNSPYDSNFDKTDDQTSVGTVGFMKAVTDLASSGSSVTTADEDITLQFADTVAGSFGSSTALQASDGFTITLQTVGGTAQDLVVADLRDGSYATIATAITTALQNAGLDDNFTVTAAGDGTSATHGITITNQQDEAFTVSFKDLKLGGATTGITTVIHEKLDDLKITDTLNTDLFSTNGVQASNTVTTTTTLNESKMYLDVLGADTYKLKFDVASGTSNETGWMEFTYDGTDASLDTFAARIQSNISLIGSGYDFSVTADNGRITITEANGAGFKISDFESEGAGRIVASSDVAMVDTGNPTNMVLDDSTYATTARADAGVANANVKATNMQLDFTGTDTYSFTISTPDASARVSAFSYENNADAIAAIEVALNRAGLTGVIDVESNGGTHGVKLVDALGREIRITDFASDSAGKVTVSTNDSTNGSGVSKILADDVQGSAAALKNLDLSTATGSAAAIDVLDRALSAVTEERANIGALQNRLDHTINNLGNIVVNTSAAQSRIQDADFAAEAAELAKAQVLQQAGTAILAQANASVQSVLSLLG